MFRTMKTIGTGINVFAIVTVIFVGVKGDNGFVDHYPLEIASNFLSILTPTNLQTTGVCSDVQASDIKYFLYTRDNPNRATTLNPVISLRMNLRKKIVLLTHGWLADANSYGFPKLKNEYLKRYDCNFIIVDWSKLSQLAYATSACYLPQIGQMIANFLCRLNGRSQVNLSTVHMLGHSLGAQLAGFVGQSTLTTCKQRLGRITGLDPAGPLFQDVAVTRRLDRSEYAMFVDVIHTNQGGLGYLGNCGDVDFYVNCGSHQPGCQRATTIGTTLCNHCRAVDYMAESISSSSFSAKPCRNCPVGCTANLLKFNRALLGEDCSRNATGAFVLSTNSQPPFARG